MERLYRAEGAKNRAVGILDELRSAINQLEQEVDNQVIPLDTDFQEEMSNAIPIVTVRSLAQAILSIRKELEKKRLGDESSYILVDFKDDRQQIEDLTAWLKGRYLGSIRVYISAKSISQIGVLKSILDDIDAAMTADKAAVANPAKPTDLGGIDMNAANLNLQIKRDGKGVPLPLPQQDWEHIKIDGLVPVILEIKPAMATPLLSELQVAGAQQAKI